jgi:hypothetical protein
MTSLIQSASQGNKSLLAVLSIITDHVSETESVIEELRREIKTLKASKAEGVVDVGNKGGGLSIG